jgi:hypothetical protein
LRFSRFWRAARAPGLNRGAGGKIVGAPAFANRGMQQSINFHRGFASNIDGIRWSRPMVKRPTIADLARASAD